MYSKSKIWLNGWLLMICVIFTLGFQSSAPVNQQPNSTSPQATHTRRVNIPYFSSAVSESQSAIFWFGRTESDATTVPGRNYVDVRMGYSPEGLVWRATGIDYYLWYKENAQSTDDLTQYDAIALYLDTGHTRADAPQTGDYYFLVGLHGDEGLDTPEYRRQARGTGSSWNTSAISSSAWTDYGGWQWECNPGPNSNTCGIDYGWVLGGTIPWSAFGLSGPPAQGTVWGMGVLMYDQDNAPGAVQLQNWPETFSANNPSTWGELHFGLANYTPQQAVQRGNVLIRSTTPVDNAVEDSWMGGGGWCNAGPAGGGEINHGDDERLFIGSEIQPTHYPCYNKSYLRFALNSIPAGKVIISATLTLHHWGGADVNSNTTSFVWLSNVTDPWGEMTIQWNNAPLAQENFSMTPIPPKVTPLVWPGDPYSWDATQAVAEAYAVGQSVSFVMYDSTTGRDSSKYLTSSEVGINDDPSYWNWDIEGRPRLDIVWGDPIAALTKRVSDPAPAHGMPIVYTLNWQGTGQTHSLTDTLPSGLNAPASLTSSFGPSPSYNSGNRQITWSGSPAAGQTVIITYSVTPQVVGPVVLQNTAQLSYNSTVSTATATIIVDGLKIFLPLIKH